MTDKLVMPRAEILARLEEVLMQGLDAIESLDAVDAGSARGHFIKAVEEVREALARYSLDPND